MLKAIDKAIDFLIRARNEERLWSDFNLPTGESDEWVTGYVGAIMAGSGIRRAIEAAGETWEVHGPKHFFKGLGGWAYNRYSPEDADSTTWGIRFARNLGLGEKLRVTAALGFLSKHRMADGGIATFISKDPLRRFVVAGSDDSVQGWMNTHACVTAAVATDPVFNDILTPFLVAHQKPQGGWDAYWWEDSIYTSSLAVESLVMNGREKHRNSIERARSGTLELFTDHQTICTGRYPGGSPFATALGVKTILLADATTGGISKSAEALRWLITQQKSDGSWEPSAVLQVPPVYMMVPSGREEWSKSKEGSRYGTITTDQHAIFTTATVLETLLLARHIMN